MLMNTPEKFRERATEYERLAAAATTAHDRDAMMYVAARWRSFAVDRG
jgi:hypothetical protein